MFVVYSVIAIVLAYLLGSISSAIIVCKVMGLPDPRSQGSQNPGATNVLRIGGKLPAIITLLGDMLKGLLPVLAANWYGFDSLVLALVACAAFLGHLYPVFFRFQGGKGVATLLGCLIGLSWLSACIWGVIWLTMAACFRYSSLAALTATILAPLYVWFITGDSIYAIVIGLIATILTYRHRGNIKKLIAGTESKIGKK